MTIRMMRAAGISAVFVLACGSGSRVGPNGKAWNHRPSADTEDACPTGYINDPDQGCIDLQTDPNNCGAVGNVCSTADDPCYDGKCVAECPNDDNNPLTNIQNCNGACIDTERDFYNCGACGNSCNDGEVCAGGECDTRCDPTQCDDPPANSTTACNQDNSCGFNCKPGYRVSADGNSCVKSCDPTKCSCDPTQCEVPPNATVRCNKDDSCGFACNPGYDPGIDGKSCVKACDPTQCQPPPNAVAACNKDSSCGFTCNPGYRLSDDQKSCVAACSSPATYCAKDNQCHDLSSDVLNCGTCGNFCPGAGGGGIGAPTGGPSPFSCPPPACTKGVCNPGCG